MNRQGLTDFNQQLKEKALDGFIVTNPTNIFYLTGFKGVSPTERESILVFSPGTKATLITARLYQTEAKRLVFKDLKAKIVHERNQIFASAKNLLKDAERIGFEHNDLRFSEYQELKKFSTGLSRAQSRDSNNNYLIPCKDLIEKMRLTKTEDEIKKIAKAQLISQKAYEMIIKTVKVGQTEEEIADNLAKIIKSLGGQDTSFESIIASGPNSGIPHHTTSRRKIQKDNIVLFDFGAKYQNYCADLSRTVFIGKATDVHKNIYWLVQTAQRIALEKIAHGIKSSQIYLTVSEHFKKHKVHGNFLHGLGHGIGLEIHEAPYLRPTLQTTGYPLRKRSEASPLLTNNMVFSVEPGLYFPWGGVRIEDLVTIASGRAKVLGQLQKNLREIY